MGRDRLNEGESNCSRRKRDGIKGRVEVIAKSG